MRLHSSVQLLYKMDLVPSVEVCYLVHVCHFLKNSFQTWNEASWEKNPQSPAIRVLLIIVVLSVLSIVTQFPSNYVIFPVSGPLILFFFFFKTSLLLFFTRSVHAGLLW